MSQRHRRDMTVSNDRSSCHKVSFMHACRAGGSGNYSDEVQHVLELEHVVFWLELELELIDTRTPFLHIL